EEVERAEAEWSKRLAACPSVQQPYLIQQYATPVRNQYRLNAGLEP
ncbi:glycerol acyltransferase, partial [Stutzerimonas stutzeri]